MNTVQVAEKESGQGLVEYALILVLVAVTVILILTILGDNVVLGYARVIGGLSGQTIDNGAILLSADESVTSDSPPICSTQLTDISFIAVDGSGNLVKDGTVSARFYGSGVAGSTVSGTASASGIVEIAGPVTVSGACPLVISMSN